MDAPPSGEITAADMDAVPTASVADAEEAEPTVEVVEMAQAGGGGTVHALADRRARLIRQA